MASILIIDDDKNLCDLLLRIINRLGHKTIVANTLKDGLNQLFSHYFDVVMLDVCLPDGNGIDYIGKIKQFSLQPDVIIITGDGDPEGAELAIRCGAYDYLQKPASVKTIEQTVSSVLEYRNAKQEKKALKVLDRNGIIGDGQELSACLNLVGIAASCDVNVLVTGETGTGKELLARAIHRNSSRNKEPFIVVDCSAIPDTLVESLLFGYEKGAYTGADTDKSGLVKQADNGTLFLDEIGELSCNVQKSFLRVLQEHRFRPVGSKKEISSNFRLITATNRDLEDMVAKGEFRKDLFFRLNSIVIKSPSLRERKEDIYDIAMYFISTFCEKADLIDKSMSTDFINFLNNYDWPGNIRELNNAIEVAVVSANNESILYPNHLPLYIRAKVIRNSVNKSTQPPQDENKTISNEKGSDFYITPYKQFRTETLEFAEKEYFTKLASISKGKLKEACAISNLSQSRLYYFFKKYKVLLSEYAD